MLDLTKPVQTRDGRTARIICTDAKTSSGFPIIALVADASGNEFLVSHTSDGYYNSSKDKHNNNLINIPEKHEMWVNCYPGLTARDYLTRKAADYAATPARIACVKVTWTDGEGLE